MSDITLILNRRDMKVTLEDDTIRVELTAMDKFERIPLAMIEKVIAIGKPLVSCDVWHRLAERNIPALLIPQKYGKCPAYFTGGISRYVTNRISQHMAFQDSKLNITIARWLLEEKLEGQECLLRDLSSDERIRAICDLIKDRRMCLNKVNVPNELMGHEGVAASLYFQALSKYIPEQWQFKGRNRRPPKDPVNALLSYTYIIAGSMVLKVIQDKGLDPSVSFLHAIHTNRENLVMDIMEPLRPSLDRFVLYLIDSVLKTDDFISRGNNGCYLTKNARTLFFQQWYEWQEPKDGESLKTFIKAIVDDLIGFFPENNSEDSEEDLCKLS
ncbi:MAG: CRISPR-associated endonuclease Cas1 [Candidatus Magnetomorum sp.]|nr:CRISPR-associated endonuclease Cas1 [Candidatus Magnetomorum sp.]